MKGIKLELLGIGVMLFGLALSTNNVFSYAGGVAGLGLIAAGCFLKGDS